MPYLYTVRIPVVCTRLAHVESEEPLTRTQVLDRVDILELHDNSSVELASDINYAFTNKVDIDSWEIEEDEED